MPEAYFAYGSTLAGLTNFETVVTTPPHVLPDGVIPLMGNAKVRVLSGAAVRSGTITAPLRFDVLLRTEFNALMYALFGSFVTASVERYITGIDETGYYSPFACTMDKPQTGENYRIVNKDWIADLEIPLYGITLQSVTKSTTATLTASERLAYCNTGSGGFTITLPLANAVQANTIVSVQKTAAANTLTISRQGTNSLNGGTTVSLTAANSRYDIVSDGVSAWTTL